MRKKPSKEQLLLCLCLAFVMTAVGCQKKESAPPVVSPADKETSTAPPIVQKQISSAKSPVKGPPRYDFSEKKDPFKPFVIETKPAKPLRPMGPTLGMLPIQSYEVSQFKVLGIITGLRENSALVADPTGKAYVIKPGMEIGNNNGKVVGITMSSIDVLEQFRDDMGRLKKEKVRLTLPRKD